MTQPVGAWTYCVYASGDDVYTATCPAHYPNRHVFALEVEDTRACAPCSCGSPEGSTCASLITLFTDDACANELASDTVTAAAQPPVCLPLPPGSALGSMSATTPVYSPGKCQPIGGDIVGTLNLIAPVTLCCLD